MKKSIFLFFIILKAFSCPLSAQIQDVPFTFYNALFLPDTNATKTGFKSTTRSSMMIYRGDELPEIAPHPVKPDSPDEKKAKDYVLGLLECFSPDAYTLVTKYYDLPDIFHFDGCLIQMAEKDDLLTWTKDLSEKELLQSLNTTVHEICHGYTARSAFAEFQRTNPFIGENDRYFHFFINSDTQLLVSYTPVMVTAEMDKTFPEKFKRDRYAIYIYPSEENMGSQVNGVYGLLDEYSAYYMGSRAAFDMYDHYFQKAQNEPKVWLDYVQSVSSTFYAYAEFRLYILHYLWYIHKVLPTIYTQILENDNFVKAFILIDNEYAKLTKEWINRLDSIVADCSANNIQAKMDEHYIYINGTGFGHFKTEFAENMHEMQKEKYQRVLQELNDIFLNTENEKQ